MTRSLDVGEVRFSGKSLPRTGFHVSPELDFRSKNRTCIINPRWNAKRRIDELFFWDSLRLSSQSRLEGKAQPKTDETTVVDTFLIEAGIDSSKVCIGLDVGNREEFACRLVHVKVKGAQLREIQIEGRTEGVVEYIVEVSAHF